MSNDIKEKEEASVKDKCLHYTEWGNQCLLCGKIFEITAKISKRVKWKEFYYAQRNNIF